MQIGMIGLGKMGASMATRLCRADIHVVGYDANGKSVDGLVNEPGFDGAYSLDALLNALPEPRKVWVMLPAGKATSQTLDELRLKLAPGDLVVNGGNSFYKETVAVAEAFRLAEIQFVDVGVSGGIHGLESGYCMMVGGEATAVQRLQRILTALAPHPNQWLHTGPTGAGHYTKMVHNGIEYGMMQAYAEGFALLAAKREFDLDIGAIAENWRHGSVVRSWLLDLTAQFLKEDQDLVGIAPRVPDSGEGRWTAMEAIELGIPAPVMSLALMSRFASQGRDEYENKLLAMMRKGFGGHAVDQTGEEK
ncbi:MAG: phosphogluconate dehydrogenase (NAD(+)-dependent, decarboxylating) [Betaproteobacteria bacterium]